MGPGTGVAHGGPRMVGPSDLLDEMADTAKARLEPGRNGEVLLRP